MRLRNTILLTIILPLLLILLTFSVIALWVLEDNLEQRQQEEVRLIAHGIRLPLTQALASQKPYALQEALSTTFSLTRLYGAFVLTPSGQQIAGVGLGGGMHNTLLLQQVLDNQQEAGRYRQQGDQNFFTYLLPLINRQGDMLGVLQINRLATGIEPYMSLMTFAALLLALVIGLLVVLMVWRGFRHYVDRPVNRLYRSMQLVQNGDRQHRTRPGGAREFRELAATFNDMLDAVAQKEHEVHQRQQKQLELERNLKKSRKLAEIGALAAGVAHELGSPLTVVDGQIQRLQRQQHLSDDVRRRLERIRHETRRMESTIRQLLDMGRRHTLSPERVSMTKMIRDAERLARDALGLEEDFPRLTLNLPDDDTLTVDHQRFQQLLDNLIKNAFQAGAGQLVITADYSVHPIMVRVEDDGPGIACEHLGHVFDPFYTTRGAGKGSGLGLTVVHRSIEDHGGHITIEKSDLGGAAFVMALPQNMPLSPEAASTEHGCRKDRDDG